MTSRDKTRRRTEWISFPSLLLSVRHLDSWLLATGKGPGSEVGWGTPEDANTERKTRR